MKVQFRERKIYLMNYPKKIVHQVLQIQITQILIYPLHNLLQMDRIIFLGNVIVQIKRFQITQDIIIH